MSSRPAHGPLAPLPADGRLARSVRTRERLVEAMLGLLDEGVLRPSAAAIAERAGVSTRLVFHHFEDLDALFSDVSERHIARTLGEARPALKEDGPFSVRLAAFVTRRADIWDRVAPVRRAALLQEPYSEEVRRRLRWSRDYEREETRRAFAPELARARGAARTELFEALVMATSYSAWNVLRVHSGLSAARARAVMRRTIAALLGNAR